MRRIALVVLVMLASCKDDQAARDRAEGDRLRARAERFMDETHVERELMREKSEAADAEETRAQERIEREAAFRAKVERLDEDVTAVDRELNAAEQALRAARTAASRREAREQLATLRERRTLLEEQIDKLKASVKLRCPPDQPLC